MSKIINLLETFLVLDSSMIKLEPPSDKAIKVRMEDQPEAK
ncbi:MAG: hypothetical protein N0A00_08915 [Candidatus Bathyarchaeota archaeon]|nr:hypothetical protein [Candidatus Bathyarchaeota archaeon]